jgi:hypothetical protein
MPAARYYFPLVQDQTQGSWMNISAFAPSSATVALTVSLFIPGAISGSNLTFTSRHEYSETKVTKAAVDAASGITSVGFGAAQAVGQMAFGSTLNPKVEVLYRDTDLRTFEFVYIMSPASQQEQTMIQNIIQSLRMYAAPTLSGSAYSDPRQGYIGTDAQAQYLGINSSYLFDSPNEFVIDFYYYDENGSLQINQNIPHIGRCVLEGIEVMYNPNGEWSTFSDGSPIATQLHLAFREMRVIDGKNIANGY